MRQYLTNFSTNSTKKIFQYDVLVVGSGVAGLTSALWLSRHFSVALITKGWLGESSSKYAQGGVAAATSLKDSPEKHLKDTLTAGGYNNKLSAAKLLAELGPSMIARLEEMGLNFDTSAGSINLALEGGHSMPRVLHVADGTGAVIQDALVRQIRNSQVDIFENCFAVDLLVDEAGCHGLIAKNGNAVEAFFAGRTVLATGGAGHIFSKTTNPELCTGDGMAMAYRAGCVLADMEFIQFHPTAIKGLTGPKSLITESIRGEGAYLIDDKGNRFMQSMHPQAELAPRDVIVRSMAELIANGKEIFLDARHLGEDHLSHRFPTVYHNLKEFGMNIGKDIIPVEPSVHYFMGGIVTDLRGRTSIRKLYACGETACSGVHGSNRLASNSLLEGLVFANQIYEDIETSRSEDAICNQSLLHFKNENLPNKRNINTSSMRLKLKKIMTENLGYIRSGESISSTLNYLKSTKEKLDYALDDKKELELANILTVAELVCDSAFTRKESRGAHYRKDFPKASPRWEDRHISCRRKQELAALKWEELDKIIGNSWSLIKQ